MSARRVRGSQLLAGALLGIGLLTSALAGAKTRPNIVIVLADDLGFADVGYNDPTNTIKTPHIDRLAKESLILDYFYTQPLCSPTRAALMTGRYPFRVGAPNLSVKRTGGIPLDEQFLSEVLKEDGYRTVITGKWHLGHAQRAYWPSSRGFDEHYGMLAGSIDYFTHLIGKRLLDWQDGDTQPLVEEGYATDLIGARAATTIKEHEFKKQPLFLYVPFTAPHSPLQAPESDLARYPKPDNNVADTREARQRRIYMAMVSALDDEVDRIQKALEERNQLDNTIFVFASDNGGSKKYSGSNLPLRGEKGTLFEGGIRVPGFISWPGVIKGAGRHREPVHVIDLFPTLLRAAKVGAKPRNPIDGKDLWDELLARKPQASREIVLHVRDHLRGAIRQGKWKLIVDRPKPHLTDGLKNKRGRLEMWLYDLDKDPEEKRNLATVYPEQLKKMRARLRELSSEKRGVRHIVHKRPDDWELPADWSGMPE